MAKLTTKQRNALPDSAFAGPNRTYPVNDRAHAIAAKAMSHGARSGKPASAAVQAAVAKKAKKFSHASKRK
jgi:hypothetical protein